MTRAKPRTTPVEADAVDRFNVHQYGRNYDLGFRLDIAVLLKPGSGGPRDLLLRAATALTEAAKGLPGGSRVGAPEIAVRDAAFAQATPPVVAQPGKEGG